MCRELVARAVEDERMLKVLRIPERFWTFIAASWKRGDPSLYGRFDLSYDGNGPAKLLEYNADTPTSVFETAVFQWMWLEDAKARQITPQDADQYNSLHERLIESWKEVAKGQHLHLAGALDDPEDGGTVAYLEDTARQAGLETTRLPMEGIGRTPRGGFIDQNDRPIELIFKLYPWEWMFREQFGSYLAGSPTRWVEPPWKAILSNKGILPLLWAMFPRHPNLLPAYFEDDPKAAELGNSFVRKPLYSREGANVTMVVGGRRSIRARAPMARKVSCARRSRPCRSLRRTTPPSARGSPGPSLAAFRCARNSAQSPRTPRDSCPTPLSGEAFPHCTTNRVKFVYGFCQPHEFPAQI